MFFAAYEREHGREQRDPNNRRVGFDTTGNAMALTAPR